MNRQLSQDYDVDSRYRGSKYALDNSAGKAFVMKFLKERQESKEIPYGPDLRTEDRFIVAGPGESNYSYRNAFRAT